MPPGCELEYFELELKKLKPSTQYVVKVRMHRHSPCRAGCATVPSTDAPPHASSCRAGDGVHLMQGWGCPVPMHHHMHQRCCSAHWGVWGVRAPDAGLRVCDASVPLHAIAIATGAHAGSGWRMHLTPAALGA